MKEIHSDYTQVPFDRILDQIIYDLDVSQRKLDVEDFPSLEIVYGLKDIDVEYDMELARKFYLHMAECFGQGEDLVACRDFSFPEYHGFTLPCEYCDGIYRAVGFCKNTRPKSGCAYCPYEIDFRCMRRNRFSPRKRISYIRYIVRLARHKFKVSMPDGKQFSYVIKHIEDEFCRPWSEDIKWMTLERAKIVWRKSYELLAFWPLKKGVKVKVKD